MKSNHKNWLIKAEEDIKTCEILLEQEFYPPAIVCFHAQQSAEKLLKAFLVYHQIEFAKIHDIVALLDIYCIPFDQSFKELREDCILLADFAVLPRYPGEWSFSEIEAKQALKNALLIKEFVIHKLK